MRLLKMNANSRFGLYVLWMTTFFVCIALSFYYEFPVFILFLMFPCMDVLGPDFQRWCERDRNISNRALVIGVIVCLVVLWIGGITLAHYISPDRKPPKYVLWVAGVVLWLIFIQPGYRWWRAEKRKTA